MGRAWVQVTHPAYGSTRTERLLDEGDRLRVLSRVEEIDPASGEREARESASERPLHRRVVHPDGVEELWVDERGFYRCTPDGAFTWERPLSPEERAADQAALGRQQGWEIDELK